jgi:MoaA/NifB/PqqE/SkfB family radical SAM enzyme/polysaccharide pyruvyl transferase WcaK-like protein
MSKRITLPHAPFAGTWKGFRYLFQPRPWPLELPVVVQFPINDICDSKCQMCNIWQQKRDREMSVAQAHELFSNPLFRNVVALGLNGGEPTLRPDLAELGSMLLTTLPRLRTLSLITNGLHAERAMARIGELAEKVRKHDGHLDVMVSLDGVGEVHDFVRGVPGNFGNAVRVLDYVQSLPGVSVRVGCTVISENAYYLHELLDFCRQRDVYVKFRLGVPNRRLYNLPARPYQQIGKRTWIDTHPFAMDASHRWHFAQFLLGLNRDYERSLSQVQFYRSLAGQLVAGAPRRTGCDWQHRGVTVSSRGEILYCAVQSDVLGDGLTADAEALYFGNRDHLRRIIEEKCASCAHDYTGSAGGRDEFELMADRWLRRVGSSLPGLRRTLGYRTVRRAKQTIATPLQIGIRRRSLRHSERDVLDAGSVRNGTMLCGWYGTETLGDKAILASIVSNIRRLDPAGSIRIASLEPAYTQLTVEQMPELTGCEVIDITTALNTVTACRSLVFAGGPLMAIPQMATMEALFRRARLAGIVTILAGCGVGPLGSTSANRTIRGVLDAAGQRLFRDSQSLKSAGRMSGTRPGRDAVCEDPAATWVAAQALHAPRESPTPILGLGLRDWPSHEYAPGISANQANGIRVHFESALLTALEKLLVERPLLRILPVPFCTHDAGGDDRLMYWRLIRQSDALRRACDTSLISREPTPVDAVAELRRCRAFLTMRFHSLVFASTLGIPVVAVDYTLGLGKTHALGQQLGCETFRIDKIDTDSLHAALHTALKSEYRHPPALTFGDRFAEAWSAGGLNMPAALRTP